MSRVGVGGIHASERLSPYHAAMLEVLTRIADGEIARDVWDEDPPTVWGIDKAHSSLTAWEMPLVDQVWDGRDGVDVVTGLAEYLRATIQAAETGLDSGVRRRVCGVALSTDSWVLDIPEDATAAEREAATEFTARRGVADHPWGAEAKSVIGVSADGWRYTVSRFRKTGTGPVWARDRARDGGMGGRYPEALDTLLSAMRTVRS